MKNQSYNDYVIDQLRLAFETFNAPMFIYYLDIYKYRQKHPSYQVFKNSPLYQEWYNNNRSKIDEFVKEKYTRYNYIWSAV